MSKGNIKKSNEALLNKILSNVTEFCPVCSSMQAVKVIETKSHFEKFICKKCNSDFKYKKEEVGSD